MTQEVVFVGIGGCSSSGKTTLSRGLLRLLGKEAIADPPISLDWYMDPTRMPLISTSTEEHNWETPEGVRFDLLLEELIRLKSTLEDSDDTGVYAMKAVHPKEVQLRIRHDKKGGDRSKDDVINRIYVLVEGYLLYYQKAVADLMSHRFWIETTYATALRRRLNRDIPTSLHRLEERQTFARWFKGHIWKHYMLYRDTQMKNAQPVCVLDADWLVENQLKRVQQQTHNDSNQAESHDHDPTMSGLLSEASACVQMDIDENAVPELKTSEDEEAMDLVRLAEQAEAEGDMNKARTLYCKVIRLSPFVAQFVGL